MKLFKKCFPIIIVFHNYLKEISLQNNIYFFFWLGT